MLWMITNDIINTKNGEKPTSMLNDLQGGGRMFQLAYGGCNDEAKAAINKMFIEERAEHEIRLLDDDGEVYFEGVTRGLDKADADAAFEPQDWAEAAYGCTTTQYRRKGETTWETL